MKTSKVLSQVLTAFFLAGVVAMTGYAQQSATPKSAAPEAAKKIGEPKAAEEGPNKVVLKVGSKSFTQSDMEFLINSLSPQMQQMVARQGRKPLGDQYALMSVLSQQAEKDHLDASTTFRQKMALQQLQALAQAEYEKLAGEIKVSPEEVKQYYDGHASEFDAAQVREFIIRKQPEGAKEGTPGLPSKEALARADEIRKALASGTDPKEVSEKFSVENTVMIDAEPRSVQHGKLVPALDKAAFELKDGEVSEPLDTPQAMAFLQVVGHSHSELKDVSEDIENALHQKKIEAAVQDLKSKSTIWMDEGYFKTPTETAADPSAAPQQQ